MSDRWPLTGRAAELDMLNDAIARRRGVILAGVAGVGKSRLVLELAANVDAAEWHVERVVGTPAAAMFPLGAFSFLDTSSESPLARARRELLTRAGERSLLLVIDDAHHLDDASAALVHQLVVNGNAVVVATVRSSERVPDAIVALWKDELCERVDLQPLARREVDRLVEAALGSKVDAAALAALWDASQGNLLFLRELLRDGARTGALYKDGEWRWRRPQTVPPSVRELIGRDIERFDGDARHAIELVAFAEPVEWSVLCAVVRPEVCERLVEEGELDVEADGRRLTVRCSHPLIADVVRDQVPETRRRRIFRTLTQALASRDGRRADTLRRVRWAVEAGDAVETRALIDAARQVMLLDPEAAERYARLALEQGGGVPAVLALAQHMMFSRRADSAEELLASATRERADVDDDTIELVCMRANNLTFGCWRADEAVALLDGVRARLDPSDTRLVRVRGQRLPLLLFTGRVREVVVEADALLEDAAAPNAERLRALLALVPALAASGRPLEAIERAGRVDEMLPGTETELPYAMGQLGAGLVLALQWAGRLDDADALARLGYDEGGRRDARLLRGISAFHLGVGAFWRGHCRTASAFLEEAVDALRASDAGFLPSAVDHLRASRASTGEAVDIDDDVAGRFPLYETERLRLGAAVHAAAGDVERARADAAAASDAAERCGLTMHRAFALWDRARYGDAGNVARELRVVAPECEGPLVDLFVRATDALATDDAGALDTVSDEFAWLGFDLWSGECARVAVRTHSRAGRRAAAARAEMVAEARAEACEGVVTPLLRAVAHDDATLTAREREVAALAARGVSNKDIGARLGLSVRTVETHLQHVYDKLGIRSRGELTELFGAT